MIVMGIESSCDETSAAVVSGAGDVVRLESLVILSQDVHRIFGGVVPEIARWGAETGTMLAISLHAVRDDLRDVLVVGCRAHRLPCFCL